MKPSEERKRNYEIAGIIVLIIAFALMSNALYTYFNSDGYKKEIETIKIFETCVEKKAKDYCEGIEKRYNSVHYTPYNSFENESLHFLDEPYRIICKDVRECCSIERYYFIEEEIDSCLGELQK